MNLYYGATKVGKRRLAGITATELESIANPIHGRSRGHRVLDNSLNKLKNQSAGATNEREVAAHKTAKRRHTVKLDSPHANLLQVLRRLDLRSKFARSIDLLRRFFKSTDGQLMIQAWRNVIQAGVYDIQPLQSSSTVPEVEIALDNKAYLVFYAAWRLALASETTQNGDAREIVLWLFENVFTALNQTPLDAITLYRSDIKVPNSLEWCVIPTEDLANYKRPQKHAVCRAADTPIPVIVSSEDSSTESADHVEIPMPSRSKEKLFFCRAMDWTVLYHNLIPVARISCLGHNSLFTDDGHIFHRALEFLKRVFNAIPIGYPAREEDLRPQIADDMVAPVENFEWHIPNGFTTLFMMKKTPWARHSVETFFQELYTKRNKSFGRIESMQIEDWQASLKEHSRKMTASVATVLVPEAGKANIPVRDTRTEVISSVHGEQNSIFDNYDNRFVHLGGSPITEIII